MTPQKNAFVDVNPIILTSKHRIILAKRAKGGVEGGQWHLPGGRVFANETFVQTLRRVAFDKTRLRIELFYPSLTASLVGIYDDPKRDPRGHIIGLGFLCKIVGGEGKPGVNIADVKSFSKSEIGDLKVAFDHRQMIEDTFRIVKVCREIRIVPAIITKTQRELDGALKRLKGKVKRVQLDVMDGEYVPNSSLDFDFQLPKGFEYEAHLMVKNPLGWVRENAEKVDIVTMHVDTLKDIGTAIEEVTARGVRVSLALTPETKIETVKPYLNKIDGVLVMTVIPGSYCIKKNFRPEALSKIKKIREIDREIPIEVDGCMNPTNAGLAKETGATTFVSGSYIWKSPDINKALEELEEAVD